MIDPRTEYSRLLEQRRAQIARLENRHRQLGNCRLALAAVAAVLLWLAWSKAVSILWEIAPTVVFIALVVVHEGLLRALERNRRAARYFEQALARLAGAWVGTGEPGDHYLEPTHAYAQDLDLFGRGSLFELLCTARTHIGENTLARWLLSPADPETIRARQEAGAELRPRLDLREDLAVLAEEARTGVDPVALAAWGEAPPLLASAALHATARALAVLGSIGIAA